MSHVVTRGYYDREQISVRTMIPHDPITPDNSHATEYMRIANSGHFESLRLPTCLSTTKARITCREITHPTTHTIYYQEQISVQTMIPHDLVTTNNPHATEYMRIAHTWLL